MELPALCRSRWLLLPILLSIAIAFSPSQTTAQVPTGAPSPSPAPAPAPSYVNITQVLVYAGDFSTFVSLLISSGVGEKFQAQANNTETGITIFAPKDKAFTTEPAATLLKNLTSQQLMSLLEYHALTSWESLAELQLMTDNVTNTFATFNGGGRYVLNVTMVKGQVEIITEWNKATITSTLYNARPVSIFALDQVLLAEDLFGLPAPAPAPSPFSGAPVSSPSSSSTGGGAGAAAGPSGTNNSFAPLSSSPAPLCYLLFLCLLCFKLF
ncbi:hypothetical protein GOP47_0022136 [Adiantum capillus-veneris]|uniref:FAS1 domain-containing protein n=1 Tax=Adiantum capillus-veneris TaxID=13818 RepID=A0A9D4U8R9_ADICA|nr:hypothetical protein GOP47_0022136 [Adiantum capillus-veneris]